MSTTPYTIHGVTYPLGTDDVIDYLAQHGSVDPSYGLGACLYHHGGNPHRDYPALADVRLVVTPGGICCFWTEREPHGTGYPVRGFADLAEAVRFFLDRKAGLPYSPASEKIAPEAPRSHAG